MKLRPRILLLLILFGWLPLALFALFSDIKVRSGLKENAVMHLAHIRDLKALQIENYIDGVVDQARVLSRSPFLLQHMEHLQRDFHQLTPDQALLHYVYNNPHKSRELYRLIDAGDGSEYTARHRLMHPFFKEYIDELGFYDLLLLDLDGNVVYSVIKESDYASNVEDSGLEDSAMQRAYRQALQHRDRNHVVLSEVEHYFPSELERTGFVASPIEDGQGRRFGVLLLQFSMGPINEVINNTQGLHQASRVMLAQHSGDQVLFLNETGFNWKERQRVAEFQREARAGKRENPMVYALQGKSGSRYFPESPHGQPLFAAWQPVSELNWGLVLRISEDHLLMEANRDRMIMVGVLGLLLMVIFSVAWMQSSLLSRPIRLLLQNIQHVGGDYFGVDHNIEMARKDEMGDLNRSFANMMAELEHNIDEREHVQEKLIEAAKSAERANKAKDDFLAAMSHELRTPLTAIIGNSQLLADSSLNHQQLELINSVEVSGQGLLSLINDILDLSKIEAGKFEIDQGVYDLKGLVDELKHIFTVRCREAGIDFIIEFGPMPQYQLVGDGRRVGQILINLLGNALKFTEQGQVSLKVWSDQQLHFEVEDSGIGMAPEVLERLFKPFEQGDSSISRRFGGTGLGLHISWTLAELMGGEITVESRVGDGSIFRLRLPCHQSTLPVVEQCSNTQSLTRDRFQGRVLVAEDTPELQTLERRLLEMVGVEVSVAVNGVEAVAMATAQPFDLVLMDMQMPEMDGIEATRVLRNKGYGEPIVALTANVMQKHRDLFSEAGCDDFLSKPIDRQELIQILRRFLKAGETERIQLRPAVPDEDIDEGLLALFAERIGVLHDELSAALKAENWEEVHHVAHTIKGSAASFGYPQLTTWAAVVCDHCDNDEIKAVAPALKPLLQGIEQILGRN